MQRTSIALIVLAILSGMALANETRPNVVVFLADDLGWGDVGWHGSEIPTPQLDKLAQSGAQLDSFYVQPVCSPTRAALMTGRYPMRHGLQVGVVRPWAQYGLPLEEQTLAQGFKSAGYATAIVGKWHLGHFQSDYLPTRRGFDHQYGHYNGALDYNLHTRDGGFDWHRDDKVCRDEGYSTHLLADEAVKIVKQYSGKQPFFLYVPFNAVHAPHQVPEKYLEKFGHLKGDRRLYAGMLTAMDEAIGKVIDAVDQAGQRDNTLFIFSSDNGGPSPGKVTSNGSLRASKGTVYEGGVRVSALASWKGKIAAGSIVKDPLHIVDLYPTLLKLAGAKVEQKLPLDGIDIWETIANGKPTPAREILINAAPNSGAIRSGQWKLVVNGKKANENPDGESQESIAEVNLQNVELFDLTKDPNEQTNLAKDNADKAKELAEKWSKYRSQAVPPKVKPKPKDFKTPEVWGEHPQAGNKLPSLGVAPKIEATDDQNKTWKSSDYVGKKNVVVYFYPADFTGGCTKQACAFRDSKADIERLDAVVVGISGDSSENHRQFKEAHQLNFTLLADPEGKIAESFGVPVTKEAKQVSATLGNKQITLARNVTTKRWTFVIDTQGNIIYKNSEVTAAEDASKVIEVLKTLSSK